MRGRMTRYRLRTQLSEIALGPGDTRIGRGATCDITIDDPCLSREHAAVRIEPTRITLRDLGSRNGTMLNGVRVHGEVEIRPGDQIELGSTTAVLGRLPESHSDLETTASFRTCGGCGSAYVLQASACPQCGRPAQEIAVGLGKPKRTDSQRSVDFWLQLEAELLDKAMSMQRLDEAEASWRRLAHNLGDPGGPLARGVALHPGNLDAALCAAVRLGRMTGNGRPIAWTLGVVQKQDRLPSPELFALLAATPPSLMASDEAFAALEDLLTGARARVDLTSAEASCRTSLGELHAEAVRARPRRVWGDAPPSRPRPWGDSLRPTP